MKAFPAADLAKGLRDIDVGHGLPPVQRSLGLRWDLVADTLTFQVADIEKYILNEECCRPLIAYSTHLGLLLQ